MKKLLNNKYLLVGATLLTGFFIGWLLKPADIESAHQHVESSDYQTWTCSMHPQIRQNEPGDCPICGMDLIPVDEESDLEAMAVNMSPTAMQLANVATAVVGHMNPTKVVNLNGKVQENERLVFTQPAHVGGRVERLAVDFTGEYVRKGQPLAYIYSPDLVTAQEELFQAYQMRESQPRLYRAARTKLKNWKLTENQIDRILESGKVRKEFPALADRSGYVTEKLVNLGDYVQRGAPIYRIADLSKVWVQFDVYESDLSWIEKGDSITFTVSSLPGEVFHQQIDFIDPVINPQTRVAQARVEIANPNLRLKPEMFASGEVEIALENKENALVVPKSAVMWTGERSVVYEKVSSDLGVDFVMREIILGPALGESYIVELGLEKGAEIAVSGTFSIDAAAQLAGKPSMMNRHGGVSAPTHDHGAIDMNSSVEQPVELMEVPVDERAREALIQVLKNYLELKNALVADNLKNALAEANKMKQKLDQVRMALFKEEAHQLWMDLGPALKESVANLLQSESLKEVREPFQQVSNQMISLTKAFGLNDQKLYVQHCPMAANYSGADWLSREEEIRNPYFGESMLTCGEVTDVLTAR